MKEPGRLQAQIQRFLGASRRMATQLRPRVIPEAIPFQDDIEEIVEEPPPRYLRSIHYMVVALFLLLLLIASLIKVDIVIMASGRLATESAPILLQPMERGIIREILVKAGDSVSKGQVLAVLDSTFTGADLAALTAQQTALISQIRRMEAEANNKPFQLGSNPSAEDQIQSTLYRQRTAQYLSRVTVYDEEINRLKANIRTVEGDRSSLSKQLEIARDVESMRLQLLKSQTGSKLQHMDSQATRMRMERDLSDASNRLTELQHDVQSKQAERQSFIDDWRRTLLESLVQARTEAAKVAEQLAKVERLNDLVVVTAPEDGVVLEVARRSVGSVMREAEPLVTIVPSNAALIADIMLASSDVGYTKPGDDVVVKVDAYPYQRHGLLTGRLMSVSEDSFNGNTPANQDGTAPPAARGGAFHRARVELTSTTLHNLPRGGRLIPGMTLNVDIKVGERSIIGYFLYPITRAFSESLREP